MTPPDAPGRENDTAPHNGSLIGPGGSECRGYRPAAEPASGRPARLNCRRERAPSPDHCGAVSGFHRHGRRSGPSLPINLQRCRAHPLDWRPTPAGCGPRSAAVLGWTLPRVGGGRRLRRRRRRLTRRALARPRALTSIAESCVASPRSAAFRSFSASRARTCCAMVAASRAMEVRFWRGGSGPRRRGGPRQNHTSAAGPGSAALVVELVVGSGIRLPEPCAAWSEEPPPTH